MELYLDAVLAEKLWDILLEAGKEEGLIPCGLGARDTLRMEAAMPRYGHEMDDEDVYKRQEWERPIRRLARELR